LAYNGVTRLIVNLEKERIEALMGDFEAHAQFHEDGVEYWLARDLQHLLGYGEWRNFCSVISKAKTACEVSGKAVGNHFVDVNKMVQIGSGSVREIDDLMLTRLACYLIAQNGDSSKPQIAFAQSYFAAQTRRAELIEKRLLEVERLVARQKLSSTEKELSQIIFEQTGDDKGFGLIRSKGDQALFGKNTQSMKSQWKVPAGRPLADFAPTIILKAKDFAAEITIFNSKANELATEAEISSEHVTNNNAVRQTLLQRGIRPESLPAEEDIKKIERRIASEGKSVVKGAESFPLN
jgi:DNA-damage-inducible protein D